MLSEIEMRSTHSSAVEDSGKRKVWLVDDDDILRPLLAEVLPTYSEIEIERTFASVPELVEALESQVAPEVLVLDVNIGADNGVDAIGRVKALAPALPVVMLTTCFDSIQRSRAYARGASDFVLKSQPVEEIAERIFAAKKPEPALDRQEDALCAKNAQHVLKDKWTRYVGGLHCCATRLNAA